MGATEPISYAATIPISAGAESGFCVRSKRRFRPLVLAVLPLAACTVGPDFVKPDAAVNPSWREQGGGIRAEESAANRDWWRSLGSPTLTTLVELAYRINPNLQVAGVRVLQAQAQLNIAIGAQFPQQQALSGSIAYQSKVPGLLASESDIVTRQIGVGATWELDFWGKYRSQAALNYNPNVSGYGC